MRILHSWSNYAPPKVSPNTITLGIRFFNMWILEDTNIQSIAITNPSATNNGVPIAAFQWVFYFWNPILKVPFLELLQSKQVLCAVALFVRTDPLGRGMSNWPENKNEEKPIKRPLTKPLRTMGNWDFFPLGIIWGAI